MSRSFINRLIVAALGCLIVALIFVVPVAFAGNLTLAVDTTEAGIDVPATATPTPTPTVTPTPTPTSGTRTTSYLPTDLFILFLFMLLVFSLLLIGIILLYVYNIQQKYYTTTQSLNQMGVEVKAISIGPFVGQSLAGADATKMTALKELKIEGPGFVPVRTNAEFKAWQDTSPATGAQWSTIPDDFARFIGPNQGEKVTLTPQKTGPFVLTASIGTPPTAQGSVSVAAVALQPTTEELPFMGQGYGSLVIAVLVVVAVILLALTGVLTSDVVATLFGGLLGYIFGVTTSTGTTSSKKTGGKPSGTSG
jgi:hypothetical protein